VIVYSGVLAVLDTAQAGDSDAVQISENAIIVASDSFTGSQSDTVALFEDLTIEAIDTIQSQTADVVIINVQDPGGSGCGLTAGQNDMLVAIYNAITSTGARVAEVDKLDIAQKVWDEIL
jgi:hypothetical protein